MKIGDLVHHYGLHSRIKNNDIGIVIELRAWGSDSMVKVFWARINESWSVPTKDIKIISALSKPED